MANENTVTIPLDDYIELRRKADENLYLATRLGAMDSQMNDLERRMVDLEVEFGRWQLKNG